MDQDEAVRAAARLGRARAGAVSARELRQAGVHESVVAALVASGRWTRPWRGTYLTGPGPVGPVELAHAALLHAGQQPGRRSPALAPVLSGLAAARALRLRWVPEGRRVQVLVGPHVQRPSHDLVLVRRTADLDAVQTWLWHGVRAAEPSRLVVDGTRECRSLRDVRGLVLGAVADRWTTPDDLHHLLDHGAVGGTAWARRAVRDAERGAASPPEAELADELLAGGLPPFLLNAELRLDGALLCVADAWFVGTGLGAEMDSRERHGDEDPLDDTLERHDRATEAGIALVHTTPTRFRRDPAAFLARVRRRLADRRTAGLGDPPGLVVVPRGPLLTPGDPRDAYRR